MGAQRARRTHPPHHPRLDHSTAAAGVEKPCRSDARGAAASKLSAMAILASREAAGLLSGCEYLRHKRLCPGRARGADTAGTDPKIILARHSGRRKASKAV